MKLRCIVGHDWSVASTSSGGRTNMVSQLSYPVTDIISICKRCNTVGHKEVDGNVTVEQLTKALTREIK